MFRLVRVDSELMLMFSVVFIHLSVQMRTISAIRQIPQHSRSVCFSVTAHGADAVPRSPQVQEGSQPPDQHPDRQDHQVQEGVQGARTRVVLCSVNMRCLILNCSIVIDIDLRLLMRHSFTLSSLVLANSVGQNACICVHADVGVWCDV